MDVSTVRKQDISLDNVLKTKITKWTIVKTETTECTDKTTNRGHMEELLIRDPIMKRDIQEKDHNTEEKISEKGKEEGTRNPDTSTDMETDRGKDKDKDAMEEITDNSMESVILLNIARVVMIVEEDTMITEDMKDLAVTQLKGTEDVLLLFQIATNEDTVILESVNIGTGEKMREMRGEEVTTDRGAVLRREVLLQVQIHLRIDV